MFLTKDFDKKDSKVEGITESDPMTLLKGYFVEIRETFTKVCEEHNIINGVCLQIHNGKVSMIWDLSEVPISGSNI